MKRLISWVTILAGAFLAVSEMWKVVRRVSKDGHVFDTDLNVPGDSKGYRYKSGDIVTIDDLNDYKIYKKRLAEHTDPIPAQPLISDQQKIIDLSGCITKIEEKTEALEDDLKFKKAKIRKLEMMVNILAYSYVKDKSRNDSIKHFINHGVSISLLDKETNEFINKFSDDLNEYDIFIFRPSESDFTELRLRKQEGF